MSLLVVEQLAIRYGDDAAVDGISFAIERGESVGLVGESGSGKSQTALAIMGLLPGNASIAGSIRFDGEELSGKSQRQLNRFRAQRIGMVFQDPMQALNPFLTIGAQLSRILLQHRIADGAGARQRVVDMLARVELPDPERQYSAYPHELSGGMRQRAMIASALLAGPDLLIADEPTTALDVTVQAQIMELLAELQEQYNTAIILITHDLGVVADVADEVAVMYAGRLVERGTLDDIFYSPEMPYTVGLLSSVPRLDAVSERLTPIPGQPPSLINLSPGCVFHPRCTARSLVPGDRCATERPDLIQVTSTHAVRCHLEQEQRETFAAESLAAVTGADGGVA